MTSQAFQKNQQKQDATMQARFVFNRLKFDFDKMPKRMDLGYHMSNSAPETDCIRFVSTIPAYKGDRGVSLIGYRMAKDEEGYLTLCRGIHGYNWSDKGFMGLDLTGQPLNLLRLPTEISLQEKDYETLAPGVLRIALSFQTKNKGEFFTDPPTFSLGTNQAQLSLQMTNLASVIVTLAVIDPKKRTLLTPEQFEKLSSQFKIPSSGSTPCLETPLTLWDRYLQEHFKELSAGIPKEIAQSILLYQRFYPME